MTPVKPDSPRVFHVARRHLVMAIAALVWAGGCNSQPTPTVPVAPASTGPTEAPASAASVPAAVKAGTFREDFDGNALDESRWKAFKQAGIFAVQEGKLELFNSNGDPDYPYILSRHEILPQTGPYYFEMAYTLLQTGPVAFCLDYMPAESPDTRPITQPFMYTYFGPKDMKFRFAAEKRDEYFTAVGAAVRNQPHTLRVECDESNQFRVIADDVELGRFTSARRASRFWIGYPQDLPTPKWWGRVKIDYVEAGELSTPSSAKPRPTTVPSASPSASDAPEAVASETF